MPNDNPVKLNDDGTYPDFIIPKEFEDVELFITTKTELAKTKWKMDLIHSLNLAGKPVDFNPDPDIRRQSLGLCREVRSKRFALASIVTRIRDGGRGKPPKVKYTLTFEAGKEIIDEPFSITSDETNPVTFYTKITFRLK